MIIAQTIVYTSGLFVGQQMVLYIRVYKYTKPVPVMGSGYRVIKEERVQ